jgi:hypothetical protein
MLATLGHGTSGCSAFQSGLMRRLASEMISTKRSAAAFRTKSFSISSKLRPPRAAPVG